MDSSNKYQTQLMVKFFTKSDKYSVADTPYSIPSNSNNETLNVLIKSILKSDLFENEDNDNKSIIDTDFDFLINSNYLLTNLDEFITTNDDIKTESIIDIEYRERYPPPTPIDTIITDDWVSSIKEHEGYILIGSYNNSVQVWNTAGECITTLTGHNGPVKAVSWIKQKDQNKTNLNLISASHDQAIMIWHWNTKLNKTEKVEKCVGHGESVECLDVNSDGTKFISGSWDKTLKLWNLLDDEEVEAESTSKKKKSDLNLVTKTPIFTLSGHSESVSSCKWMTDNTVCTSSWDHSIKLWDVFIGQETRSLKSNNKIFLSIDYSTQNQLIAAGHNDPFIRIYDPRSNEGNIVKHTLSSHTGWCTSVVWSLSNQNMLVSGSHDAQAKLWDIRNTKSPIYDMLGHEDKILCVDWSEDKLVLTGSADNTFKMYKTL